VRPCHGVAGARLRVLTSQVKSRDAKVKSSQVKRRGRFAGFWLERTMVDVVLAELSSDKKQVARACGVVIGRVVLARDQRPGGGGRRGRSRVQRPALRHARSRPRRAARKKDHRGRPTPPQRAIREVAPGRRGVEAAISMLAAVSTGSGPSRGERGEWHVSRWLPGYGRVRRRQRGRRRCSHRRSWRANTCSR
jgi:hypothetical protein